MPEKLIKWEEYRGLPNVSEVRPLESDEVCLSYSSHTNSFFFVNRYELQRGKYTDNQKAVAILSTNSGQIVESFENEATALTDGELDSATDGTCYECLNGEVLFKDGDGHFNIWYPNIPAPRRYARTGQKPIGEYVLRRGQMVKRPRFD